MSNSAESRIVTMQFNNSQFEKGAAESLTTLQKLKAALSFDSMKSGLSKATSGLGTVFSRFRAGASNPFASAQKGMVDLQKQANSFSPAPMIDATAGISKSFIAMSAVAITAISNITNRAINSSLAFGKSFTFAPVLDGLREYETNLKSIQTVQANTDRPLPQIERALEELNKYSDQTIYNFSEMARNVGTFTAAGVDLETSVSSIKGIANIAALSGSSSQQAATAMYQLSQAIAAGRVGLMDWNSVVNAGMGGKKLQNALAQTAVAMGELDKSAVKMVGPMQKLEIEGRSFRESIMAKPGEQSWLSSEALVNTLAAMDGRFSVAAQKAELTEEGLRKYSDAQIEARIATARTNLEQKNGVKYSDEQFAALQKMSTSAFKAATEVKTLGQVFSVAKETIASGWSASFKNIFGSLDEAKKFFTGMSRGLNNIINENALARNYVLNSWKEGGGRDTLITGLTSAWTAFSRVLGTVQDAFREVFPAKTGADLISMSESFAKFTESMIPSKDTLEDLRRIAAGVFAAFSIGISIVKGIAGVIGDLLGVVAEGKGSFFEFAGGIGDFVVAIDDAIKKGGILNGFFDGLSAVLSVPLTIIREVAEAIANMFSGLDAGAIDGIEQRLSPLEGAAKRIQTLFTKLGDFFSSFGDKVSSAFSGVGDAVASAFTAETFGQALDVINTALLGGIVLLLKNFFSGFSLDLGGRGFTDSIRETLGGVTDALKTMQTNLKANILLKIAGAVGILAVSLLILSTIDPKRLSTAFLGLAATFALVTFYVGKLSLALTTFGTLKLSVIAASLMALATAMVIFAAAIKIFASMDFGKMLRGLVGMAATFYILTKAVVPLSANAAGMVRVGAGLILVAFALRILANVVERFGQMDLAVMAKGLGGVAGSLVVLAGAMRIMPKNIFLQAAGLLVLGVALKAIGSAVSQIGKMDVSTLATGIGGIAAALVAIGLAMRLMPGPKLLIQAAALVVLSGALAAIGLVVSQMGGMTMEEIAKGLGTMAGALLILSAALYLMTGTLAGSAALTIAVGALTLLVPILAALGSMDVSTIATALGALAGTFAVLGVAGMLLGPLVPVLLGLSVVIAVLGAGMALAGAGALAFATAFGIVVAAGAAGAAVLGAILGVIIASIPAALRAFGEGIVEFASAIAEGGPAFFRAFSTILNSLLDAAAKAIPKIGRLFMQLMTTVLIVVRRMTPAVINTAFAMIVGFLAAVAKNVPKITQLAADIIVRFINGISKALPRIIQAGVRLIISFVNGVANAIRNNQDDMIAAGGNLADAIIDGMIAGLRAGVGAIGDVAKNVAKSALDSAKSFLGIESPSKEFMKVGTYSAEGMAIGLSTSSKTVERASMGVAKNAMTAMRLTMSGMAAGVPELSVQPTIKPVLDLSGVRNDARGLSGLLDQNKMRAELSYQGAASVSDEMASAAELAAKMAKSAPSKTVTVEVTQNNTSPEPLDAGRIYRNTKGLLALTKEALESDESN